MNTVEIKILSNGLENHQALALSNFLTSLGAVSNETPAASVKEPIGVIVESIGAIVETAKDAVEVVRQTRQRTKKEKPTEEIEVKEPETVTPGANEEEAPEAENNEPIEEDAAIKPSVTLMQIRSLVAAKSSEHKDALRGKLKEFGVANVSSLEEKDYDAFFTFADKL